MRLAFWVALAAAQTFQSATILPSAPSSARPKYITHADGFDGTNMSLWSYIQWAYSINNSYQIAGPGWLGFAKFDISAKAPSPIPEPEVRVMLQALLEERFHLKAHRDTQMLPGYSLVVTKTGLKIHPVEKTARPGPPTLSDHALILRQSPFAELVRRLEGLLSCPIEDATHVDGLFDFELKWTPDPVQSGAAGETASPETAEPGPSLFDVLESQIGVRLEKRKLPVEMMVIEHIDRAPAKQ